MFVLPGSSKAEIKIIKWYLKVSGKFEFTFSKSIVNIQTKHKTCPSHIFTQAQATFS
jgi:hypothetical protein